MTDLPAADRHHDTIQQLLSRISKASVRERLNKSLVLWDLGYVRESLTQFRVAAEEGLQRISASVVPANLRPALEASMQQGQAAKVIERLHHDAEVIPARIALHLHTLLAWGNYASHHQKLGHHARPSDLVVLISVAVDLEDWLCVDCERGASIFLEDAALTRTLDFTGQTTRFGLHPEVASAFIALAGRRVIVEPHRLVAPHLSVELYWGQPPGSLEEEALQDEASLPVRPNSPPYRGLQAFDPEDADRFYGRAALRQLLVNSVDTSRLTLVCGASGSGKTSLLRAGLVPELTKLGCSVLVLSDFSPQGLAVMRELLASWSEQPLVLILDQFERALLHEGPDELRRYLLDVILRTGLTQQGRRVVIGIREDFLGRLLRETKIAGNLDHDGDRTVGQLLLARPDGGVTSEDQKQVQSAGTLVVVGPMNLAETRDAVVRPLEGTGVSYQPTFLEHELLPDLLESSGATPSRLQIVCGRLYSEARKKGERTICGATFDALGGFERILSTYLEEMLGSDRYTETDRNLAIALLKAMTGEVARRWLDLGELWKEASPLPTTIDEVQIRTVLSRLMDDRLVLSRSRGPQEAARYSLMHDQLMVVFKQWTTPDELERQQARDQLEKALQSWTSAPAEHRELLTGRALKLVEQHWEQIKGSIERRSGALDLLRRSRRQRLARRAGLAALVTISVLGLVFGVFQLRRAVDERDHAVWVADQGVLLSAYLELDRDPTVATAWLRNLKLGSSGIGGMTLLEEARRRGVAKVLRGHEHLVTVAAYSPDGRMIVSASRDRTIRFWDPATLRQQGEALRGHSDIVSCVAFSPDGKLIASSSWDRTIRLWQVASPRRQLAVLRGHGAWVNWVTFRPDGRFLASGDAGGQIRRWRLIDRVQVGPPLSGHDQDVMSVAYSPDGGLLASGSLDRTVRLWDGATGDPVGEPMRGHDEGVYAVAFSPSGQLLATASRDETLRLWDVRTMAQLDRPIRGHAGGVLTVAFSPDGKSLASAGADKVVRQWSVADSSELAPPLKGHLGLIHHISFAPDGNTLVSASLDHTIRVWNLRERRAGGLRLRGHQGAVEVVAFSPDGRLLASGGRDHQIRIWDSSTQSMHGSTFDHGAMVLSMAFAPDGRRVISGGSDGSIKVWRLDKPSGAPALLGTHGKEVAAIAIAPDGKTLATGSDDGSVRLWQLPGCTPNRCQPTGQPTGQQTSGRRFTGHTDSVLALAFTPDGDRILSSGRDRSIRNCRLSPPAGCRQIGLQREAVYSLAISPDGRYLASGAGDATLQLWDLRSLQPVGEPVQGHQHWVLSVAFSPDGSVLASGSTDGTVRLWNTESRRPLGPPLRGHSDWVNSVAFSPDGKTLASASSDRTIWLWQLSETKLSHLRARIDALTNVHVRTDGRVEIR